MVGKDFCISSLVVQLAVELLFLFLSSSATNGRLKYNLPDAILFLTVRAATTKLLEEVYIMVDMRMTGAYISGLRKEKDMTQVELADLLNMSHQAVSKWERGESFPDIGTLPRLAEIFDVSIDDLLMDQASKERRKQPGDALGGMVYEIANGNPDKVADMIKKGELELESVIQMAPIIRTSTFDCIADGLGEGSITMDYIAKLAPFLGRETLDKLLDAAEESTLESKHLKSLAPFLGRSTLDRLVEKIGREQVNEELVGSLAPFLSRAALDILAQSMLDGNNCTGKSLKSLAPFLSSDMLDQLAKGMKVEELDYELLRKVAPFLRRDTLSSLLEKLPESALSAEYVRGIAPFLSREVLRKLVGRVNKEEIDMGMLKSLVPFLDGETMDRIADDIVARKRSI